MKKKGKKVSLRSIFLGLQDQMISRLSLNRRTLHHPVAKGDATEFEWVDLLSSYLPTRYQVERAFVIDHAGRISEQIDVVIFDRHFSPFLFRQNGQTYVPAESIYAVIEVKQDLNATNLKYAAKKISSVRRLTRTSARIVDRGVSREPRNLPVIIGGIVCLAGNLTGGMEKLILSRSDSGKIDLGCSLQGKSFHLDRKGNQIEQSQQTDSLIFFFLKLLARLQDIGTVPPMEIDKYATSL